MSRFIEIHSNLINVDHIVMASFRKDGAVVIHLDSGKKIECDGPYMNIYNAILGRNHIMATAPCEGVYAIIDGEEKEIRLPVQQLAVTAAGTVRPLDVSFFNIEFFDAMESFRGLTHKEG